MSGSDDDQSGVPLFEGFSDSSPPSSSSKKRKQDAPAKEETKSSKRRKLKKPKDVDDEALDADLGVNHAIGHMDSRLMADHIAQRTKRFRPELSLVEIEEVHVPGSLNEMSEGLEMVMLIVEYRESNPRHHNLGETSDKRESRRLFAAICYLETEEERSQAL